MKATQHMDGGGRPFAAAAAASDGGSFQAGYYRSRIKQYYQGGDDGTGGGLFTSILLQLFHNGGWMPVKISLNLTLVFPQCSTISYLVK